jgi:large subunit ribosomal protein L10
MPSILKQYMLSEYEQRFENINSMIFFDYQRIAANDLITFKNQLAEEGIKVVVVKNTIFQKLMEKRGVEGLGEIMKGPVAVAYGAEDGAVITLQKLC